jgi:sugar transferase (PEP-CTERM/EpsH1 system associated)
MGEILFLAHRMPFPPDRGDKIRSCHVLRHLATLAPVHVATFAETDKDLAEEPQLVAVAASHCLVSRTKPVPLAGVEALLKRRPVSLTAFHSDQLATYVRTVLEHGAVDTIYVFSGQMGQYIPDDFSGRVILDFVDVDSAKFEAYAQAGGGPRAWLDAREGRLLRAEEARLARRAAVSLLVSDEEAALFAARLAPANRALCDVRALQNGIDSVLFDPAAVQPEPRLLDCAGPRLIFTGQMDYAPNITAARRAIERLMPRISAVLPDATFHVVGRNPPEALRALDGVNGSRVWGEVDDIRTWLAGADLALVPLELARGVQNKVLEAMAMCLPVVLTPSAATGIGACHGRNLMIADDDDALVEAVLTLSRDATLAGLIGQQARAHVISTLSWQATMAPLAAMLSGAEGPLRHAA